MSLTLFSDVDRWERFQEGRFSPDEIARDPMLMRWDRCARTGLSADGPAEPVTAPPQPSSQVVSACAPFEAFAQAMASEGYCALLADPRGVVWARTTPENFAGTLLSTRLIEGAIWSETARGTNAIGTALAERAPVAVVGAAHFEERNHVLTCYAAPIRDVHGNIVAVLDATGPVDRAHGVAHAAVVAAAAAMESLLVRDAYAGAVSGGLPALERLIAALPHAAFLLEPTGRVRCSNTSIDPSDLDLPGAEIEPIGGHDPVARIVHLIPRPRARRAAPAPSPFAAIAGTDPIVSEARERAARFAGSDLPILFLAETGTGKELFARAVHAAGDRARGAFVAVNCGALTGSLLESELFGYGPGAFTGASTKGSTGKLGAADGGTLFLDEVAEMSAPVQAMLLRFLEDGTYYRVGESAERRANVRLLAATCRDLPAMIADGRFRSDLYYRMRGVTIRLPALRQRTDRWELVDILLARVAEKHGRPKPVGLSPAASAWIDEHRWPGNVRELRTALEYAMVMAEHSPRIELWHLPVADAEPQESGTRDLRESAERTALLKAMEQSAGNMSEAARRMGVARSTLYRMLDRHGLRS